jgi:RNA polymerase sigma-70 factor, ECF subfamily
MTGAAAEAIEEVYRDHWPRLVALILRQFRDLDIAEEAVQDSFVAALDAWARDGIPRDRFAWLAVASRRRALDRVRRRNASSRTAERLVATIKAEQATDIESVSADDELSLVLACSHPCLAPDAQVALTLREGLRAAAVRSP